MATPSSVLPKYQITLQCLSDHLDGDHISKAKSDMTSLRQQLSKLERKRKTSKGIAHLTEPESKWKEALSKTVDVFLKHADESSVSPLSDHELRIDFARLAYKWLRSMYEYDHAPPQTRVSEHLVERVYMKLMEALQKNVSENAIVEESDDLQVETATFVAATVCMIKDDARVLQVWLRPELPSCIVSHAVRRLLKKFHGIDVSPVVYELYKCDMESLFRLPANVSRIVKVHDPALMMMVCRSFDRMISIPTVRKFMSDTLIMYFADLDESLSIKQLKDLYEGELRLPDKTPFESAVRDFHDVIRRCEEPLMLCLGVRQFSQMLTSSLSKIFDAFEATAQCPELLDERALMCAVFPSTMTEYIEQHVGREAANRALFEYVTKTL